MEYQEIEMKSYSKGNRKEIKAMQVYFLKSVSMWATGARSHSGLLKTTKKPPQT